MLFTSISLGNLSLKNRVVMAPMTRARSPGGEATLENARYYSQRASAGLIVTEGLPISPQAQGFAYIPGIWTTRQTQSWRLVTHAVHENGGIIFAQLWHVGRLSHTSLQPNGMKPVSASDVTATGNSSKAFVPDHDGVPGFVATSKPQPLTLSAINNLIDDYVRAAENAIDSGFDGVEIHSANGYLLEQFLNPHTNLRNDKYGGSIENRIKLAVEITKAVVAKIGENRVGVRLSPGSQIFDMPFYPEWQETYLTLANAINDIGVGYIHLNDELRNSTRVISMDFLSQFRESFKGLLILAGGMSRTLAEEYLEVGLIDLAAYGKPFISNPDLVFRLREGKPLTVPDETTFYGGGKKGYTDYLFFNAQHPEEPAND